MNLTEKSLIFPKRLNREFDIPYDLQNYLINLSFNCNISNYDRVISEYIKTRKKDSILFDINISDFDYLTKVGLTISNNVIFKENCSDYAKLYPFAEQDRFDEGKIIRKKYYLKTDNLDVLNKWFGAIKQLTNKGDLLYYPQIKIDRQFDTTNYIEENTDQLKYLYTNNLSFSNIEPLLELDIPHFNNIDIKELIEIAEQEPQIAGTFGNILISGLLEIKNCSSEERRKLIIKRIKREWKIKANELDIAHKRLKRDLFINTQLNIFSISTLIITGFYLENNIIYYLIPGGALLTKQISDIHKYFRDKKLLKNNEFYFLFLLKKK